MLTSKAYPLARERILIVASVLALAAIAWALIVWQASGSPSMGMSFTMGLAAPLFLALWVAMMMAMMFPAAVPMILTFASVSGARRANSQAFVPTWVFVGSYQLVWTVFGGAAYGLAYLADSFAGRSPWLSHHLGWLGGGLLILAGLYQLSPLKHACLSKCRTPLTFVLTSWRDGWKGALIMGLQHGLLCLGCCWLLFIVLLPLGMMNVGAMALITALIVAEKSLPMSRIAQVFAIVLIAYGAVVLFVPGAFPTTIGAM